MEKGSSCLTLSANQQMKKEGSQRDEGVVEELVGVKADMEKIKICHGSSMTSHVHLELTSVTL